MTTAAYHSKQPQEAHYDPETGDYDGQLVAIDLVDQLDPPTPAHLLPIPDNTVKTLFYWAMDLDITQGARMVLLTVIRHVKWADGTGCTASIPTLAREAHQTKKTTIGHIKTLIDAGLISRKRRFSKATETLLTTTQPVSEPSTVSVETTPTVSVETTPTVSVETTPTVSVETTPTVSVETTPTVSVETTPTVSVETTPTVSVETTPTVSVETTPTVSVETTPTVSVETTPTVSVETTPTVSVETTPTVSVETTPTVSVETTPTVSVETTLSSQRSRNASNQSSSTNPGNQSKTTARLRKKQETKVPGTKGTKVPLEEEGATGVTNSAPPKTLQEVEEWVEATMPASSTFLFADAVLKRYKKQWWCPFTGSNPKSGFAATTPRSKAVEKYMGSPEDWKRLRSDLKAKAFQDGGPFPVFDQHDGGNPKLKEPVLCFTCKEMTMAYGEKNTVFNRLEAPDEIDKCDECLSGQAVGVLA